MRSRAPSRVCTLGKLGVQWDAHAQEVGGCCFSCFFSLGMNKAAERERESESERESERASYTILKKCLFIMKSHPEYLMFGNDHTYAVPVIEVYGNFEANVLIAMLISRLIFTQGPDRKGVRVGEVGGRGEGGKEGGIEEGREREVMDNGVSK
jgi:hypothetical protein